MKDKKLPQRKCIGCMSVFDKRDLIRIVREPEGTVIVDLTGKKNGRGAYICKNAQCLKNAYKKKRLEYAFKCSVDGQVYAELEKRLIEEC